MAYSGEGQDLTLPAAADFSSGYQYRFMTVDANGRGTICTAATDPIIGILQNKPAAQDPARIRYSGISKMLFGAAANEGALITSGVEGYGTAAALNQVGVVVGAIALAAPGGSGDIQSVLITRFEI